MTKEERKAIEYFKALNKLTFEPYLSILLNLIEKQQKEIEVLREENFDTIYMKAVADFKDKIRAEIKELEEMKLTKGDIFFKMRDYAVLILNELLEE